MAKITLIAAVSDNACIGKQNQMPWHIPEDFAFFKAYTLHKPVIMGRKTWESLPKKPLPERRNIVVSKQENWHPEKEVEVFSDLHQALANLADEEEIIIMGGAQIYTQALDLATDLRLTEVHLQVDGDAFFPPFSQQEWREINRETHQSSKGIAFDFVHYQKV